MLSTCEILYPVWLTILTMMLLSSSSCSGAYKNLLTPTLQAVWLLTVPLPLNFAFTVSENWQKSYLSGSYVHHVRAIASPRS